jgi:predicted DNA-binding WGR domain protein
MGNFSSERTMLRYEDLERNVNKFYEVTTVDMGRAGYLVIKRWGRNTSMHDTTGGQNKTEWYPSYGSAKCAANEIIEKKWRKGYSYHGDRDQGLDIPDHVIRAFYSDAPQVGVPVFTSVAEAEAWLDAHSSIGV